MSKDTPTVPNEFDTADVENAALSIDIDELLRVESALDELIKRANQLK